MPALEDVHLKDFDSLFSLDGKVAVVTGGSRGLGLHAASGLLQSGCSKVYITSRKAEACDAAVEALNGLPNIRKGAKAISLPADSSRIEDIQRLVAEVSKTTEYVDILLANAGATWGESFDTHSYSQFGYVMDLNVKSVFGTVQGFSKLLQERATVRDPSRIIITGSVAGIGIGTLGSSATFGYSASKAAVMHLAKNLALELGPHDAVPYQGEWRQVLPDLTAFILEAGEAKDMLIDYDDETLAQDEPLTAEKVVFQTSKINLQPNPFECDMVAGQELTWTEPAQDSASEMSKLLPLPGHGGVSPEINEQEILSTAVVDSEINRALLLTDLETLRQKLSSVPRFLIHMPTVFVDHYFDSVCPIFSTFDNSMNHFRSVVNVLWSSWEPLYYNIQSMAAAHLSNDFPHLRQAALQLQSDACESMRTTSPIKAGGGGQPDDKIILTSIMLGLTTAWHRSEDLGHSHLQTVASVLRWRRQRQGQGSSSPDAKTAREDLFYEQCILYWEMLSAMMSDVTLEMSDIVQNPAALEAVSENVPSSKSDTLLFPHPWTGVSPNIVSLFTKTGRLVRQARNSQRSSSSKEISLDFFSVNLDDQTVVESEQYNQAEALEQELLAFSSPSVNDLVDTGDTRTPRSHFIQAYECYRWASLVLIYRHFPTLLRKRSPDNAGSTSPQIWRTSYMNHILNCEQQEYPDRTWVTSLAVLVLKRLEALPTSSGTRFLQPMIILSTACELHFPIQSATNFRRGMSVCSGPIQIDSEQIDIARARRFVLLRLHELQIELPKNPILKIKKIIKETWRRMDMGVDVFWLDVMTDNRWETIAG